jgi:lysozyme|tara:strand:+ start:580 stop:1029 length:450 start_codon:yes stop_codon:yes gene_type:complete
MIKLTDELRARVQDHEGLRTSVYLDSLGKKTVGIGHLVRHFEEERFAEGVEIPMEEILEIFEMDLNRAAAGADMLIEDNVGHDLPQHVAEVVLEMVFQLGTTGVSKFKKFWKALRVKDYKTAAAEMQDSRWHSQTPKRCESLAEIVANT